MSMMLRRQMMQMTGSRYLGTSDFSVENKLVYRAAKEYTDIYLFDTEKEFTILADIQVIDGDGDGGINLDFISGGAVTNGSFTNGLGIRRYQKYIFNYLFGKGPYVGNLTVDHTARKIAIRYTIADTNNVKGWINSKTSTGTATYKQSSNPLWFGGSNGGTAPTSSAYGQINQMMVYYRALSDLSIENYINNGIIP